MKAMGQRVLVREPPAVERSDGGVFLPHTAREERNVGEVVSVGAKVLEDINVGDTVRFTKYDGQEVKDTTDEHGNVLVILHEKEIIAILEEESA